MAKQEETGLKIFELTILEEEPGMDFIVRLKADLPTGLPFDAAFKVFKGKGFGTVHVCPQPNLEDISTVTTWTFKTIKEALEWASVTLTKLYFQKRGDQYDQD